MLEIDRKKTSHIRRVGLNVKRQLTEAKAVLVHATRQSFVFVATTHRAFCKRTKKNKN